jgi:hypothetical protein
VKSATVIVRILNHSYAFEGPGVLHALRTLHIRFMRDRNGGQWLCPADDGERVYAYLLARGHKLEAHL